MEVRPSAEILDGRYHLFKVNFSKILLVALIFLEYCFPCQHRLIEEQLIWTQPLFHTLILHQWLSVYVTKCGLKSVAWFVTLLQACELVAWWTNRFPSEINFSWCDGLFVVVVHTFVQIKEFVQMWWGSFCRLWHVYFSCGIVALTVFCNSYPWQLWYENQSSVFLCCPSGVSGQ